MVVATAASINFTGEGVHGAGNIRGTGGGSCYVVVFSTSINLMGERSERFTMVETPCKTYIPTCIQCSTTKYCRNFPDVLAKLK